MKMEFETTKAPRNRPTYSMHTEADQCKSWYLFYKTADISFHSNFPLDSSTLR